MRLRLILDAEDYNVILAYRAAMSLLKHPKQKDTVIAFDGGDKDTTIDFYAKRNKKSVSVRQLTK